MKTSKPNRLFEFAKQTWPYGVVTAPILAYWISWSLSPSYWFNTDPQAWYFLDSLAIFAGKTYVYVDHPGTPLQLIGSALLALTYPFFGGQQAFINYYLSRPETFFFLTNLFLLAINLLTAVLFYRIAAASLQYHRRLGAIALSLAFFAIHPHGFSTLTYWSHNSFNILGTLWLLWFFHELSRDSALDRRKLLLLGFSAGALSMTQLYLLAWPAAAVITIFVFDLRLHKPMRQAVTDSLWILSGSLLGILALLLPIYRELPRFWNWLLGLILQQGVYGSGQSGVYSLAVIPLSLVFWWQYLPLLIEMLALVLTLLAAVAYFSRKLAVQIPPGYFALAVGLLVQIGLLIIVLSKLFYRLRYALSVAAVLPVLMLVAVKLVELTPWRRQWAKPVFYLLLLASIALALPVEISGEKKEAQIQQEAAVARSQVVTHLAQMKHIPEKEVRVVYASGTPIKCAGLLLANNWIGAFDHELAAICPNQYAIYDFSFAEQMNLTRQVPPLNALGWDVVVWPGTASQVPLYLDAIGAVNVPRSWGVLRAKWFYIHPEDAH